MASLPAPRHFLTSLINAISGIPLAQPEPQPARHGESSINPLKAVPRSHRPLMTTLHVLFPTLLLPALDVLDRRLVTRLWLVPQRSDETAGYESPDDGEEEASDGGGNADGRPRECEVGAYEPEPAAPGGQQYMPRKRPRPPPADHEEEEELAEQEPVSHIFTVRSSQSAHPRRRKDVVLGGVAEDPAQKMYIVRLGAWNCTCAAFAFAAFPGAGSRQFSEDVGAMDEERGVPGEVDEGVKQFGNGDWEFGGMSLDGAGDGGGVPCCKHLLACLLAERWQAGFGEYIEERRVGRNEMAGIVADI